MPRDHDQQVERVNFRSKILIPFLDILDSALPLCSTEWEVVLREHEIRYPGLGRTIESLKRKFSNLHRKKMPTGDPLMPPAPFF